MIYLPRTYKNKGVHTRPENAGIKNMPEGIPVEEESINDKLIPCFEHGNQLAKDYGGSWTDELLNQEVTSFFEYCCEKNFKPTMPLLQLWLGVSRTQFYDWRTKPEKYGEKSNICNRAMLVMEAYLQANVDKYPTGSTFLLKTTHGHRESVDVNVTSQNASKEDIGNAIANLGLDKPEE